MKADQLLLLHQELTNLEAAAQSLQYSYEKCLAIGLKAGSTQDELEKFEALTSRFARLADLLVQNTFRLIDAIDLEFPGTIRDRINRAVKKGLIDDAATFIECRQLRNDIAYEYHQEALVAIFNRVLELTPVLMSGIITVKNYCQKYS